MLPGSAAPAAGSGMFVPTQTVGTVLCCICGVAMQPNPANMCARCIRARVDITEGVPRHAAVVYCPDCTSYLQPPRSWLRAGPESPELMQILLRRLNRPLARLRVSLSAAEFVFSEPHSKRLRLKLRLRREVFNAVVLEQTHPVEFTVHDRLCDACARAQSNPDQWVAVVQLRQHVPHRRTFLYLEQLLLKHGQASLALRVAAAPGGLDFFFGSRSHAARLVDFLATVAPVQTQTAKQLVSHDTKSNVYNYKHTFSVEICPICREDLIALSPQVSRDLGGLGPIVLCIKVTNAIALLDPLTLRVHHLEEKKYRVYNFKAALTSKQLVEYIVLDIEHESPEITIDGSRYQLAYAQVARVSDFGKNDTMFTVRTHLGHLLNPGDLALGYDLYGANLNDDDMDTAMMRHSLPEVILVKKSFAKRPRTRRWKLKRLPMEEDAVNKAKGELEKRADEYEEFLRDLEHNSDIRFQIDLYKDEDYRSEMASTIGDDVPTMPIEELIEDLSLGDDEEEDEGGEGNQHAVMAQSALAEAAAASGVALPKGPIDVAKHVVREAGMKGLFKGLVPTMGREVPGNAVMFGVYEGTKQYLAGGQDTSNLGRGSLILSGGLAGAVFWLSVYPTDVVKSVIQVDDYKKPRYSGSVDAFKKILAADGVKGLYKGFGPAMARSVPANAATFLAYEITRSALG
uniref:60S ribosomal export protein NMD3 n=1 Tax=Oryza rufipogon TaxID=4529 RepID=A0A0E0R2T7_ORYRU